VGVVNTTIVRDASREHSPGQLFCRAHDAKVEVTALILMPSEELYS
jgi:hypothetical protein